MHTNNYSSMIHNGQKVEPRAHTLEHHSAMKRREALTLATTWMDPENTMLSERSQIQKDTQCVIPLIGNVQNRPVCRDSGFMVVRSWGRGTGRG